MATTRGVRAGEAPIDDAYGAGYFIDTENAGRCHDASPGTLRSLFCLLLNEDRAAELRRMGPEARSVWAIEPEMVTWAATGGDPLGPLCVCALQHSLCCMLPAHYRPEEAAELLLAERRDRVAQLGAAEEFAV